MARDCEENEQTLVVLSQKNKDVMSRNKWKFQPRVAKEMKMLGTVVQ